MDKSQEDQKSSSNPSAGTELIPAAPTPSAEVSPELKPSHPIEDVLLEFMGDMHNIRNTATVTLPHIIEWLQSERKKTRQSLVKFEERKEGRTTIYSATKAGEAAEMMRLVRYMEDLQNDKTWSVLVESTFTHIFAKLDSFIGVLLRVIYLKKDELLRGIERQITLTQILNFESLSQIKEYLLDQEIDSFRRDSYMEQFVALEKKFSVVLRKFPEWGEFVELTQRRNILMHNGGVVSEQYLTMCKREGHQWKEEPKIGEALTMLPEYYSRSIFLVEKVGFMLAHTLWRKVFPGEISIAQEAANSAIYSLLERKRWLTAGEFGQFALTEMMKKNLDEADLRIRIVNTSIGLKFSGKAAAASALLDSIDWSASYRDFKLATATLKEDYKTAAKLMRSIGKQGEMVSQLYYHTWPLFHKFRETKEFLLAYQEIYGEPFSVSLENPKGCTSAATDIEPVPSPRPPTTSASEVVRTKEAAPPKVRPRKAATRTGRASGKPRSGSNTRS